MSVAGVLGELTGSSSVLVLQMCDLLITAVNEVV